MDFNFYSIILAAFAMFVIAWLTDTKFQRWVHRLHYALFLREERSIANEIKGGRLTFGIGDWKMKG